MAALAQMIADRFLGQQVNLLRLSASERNQVFAMLGALQSRVLAKMDTQIPLPGFGAYSQQRLNALFQITDKLMQQQYDSISALHDTTLIDVSGFQSQQARKIVNALVGAPLMTVGLPLNSLKALVQDDLVDGRPAAYWWDQQATTLKTRYRDEIRQGVFAGDTQSQMKQRVRGTKAQNYQDGIMAVTSRNADALIRTSILSVANAARYETLKANDDVIGGMQWLATLDPRTCVICMALDKQTWTLDGEKVGDTTQQFPGPPPQHFNCRCTLVPVLKSWEQMASEADDGNKPLAKKLDQIEADLGPGTRSSMDGAVSAGMTYEEWLKTQPVDGPGGQIDILGQKRYDLWQADQIDVQDMVDQNNRPLNLDQIKARADLVAPAVKGDFGPTSEAAAVARLDAEMAAAVAEADQAAAAAKKAADLVDAKLAKAEAAAAKKAAAQASVTTMISVETKTISSVEANARVASSGSYVITFDDGSRAMFKPKIEESPKLRNTIKAGTYYQREAAAYDVAKIVGLDDLIPETVIRTVNGELGSVQAFAENATPAGDLYGSDRMFGKSTLDVQRAALFDAVMGNTDRHAGNWMIRDAGDKLTLIDNGLILPTRDAKDRLRINFIGGVSPVRDGTAIPDALKVPWRDNWDAIDVALRHRGIESAAIRLAERRLERILQPGSTWGELEDTL